MRAYHITGKQLVALALLTAVFASSIVVLYDKFGPSLLGRLAGAKVEKTGGEAGVNEITDPSATSDERNNAEVYRSMSPGVVNITSTTYVRDWFSVYQTQGSGSGSILDKEGYILTNYHVVEKTQSLDVALANNHHYKAKVIGVDEDNDLAVIKITAPREDLSPIPLGSSKELFVGQKVLAIGNPFGFDRTLTRGIVSGLARPLRSEFTGRLIEGVIQTDASINPGNSGGPLLDSHGRMAGINTMIYSPSGGSVGIGFAVPVDTAKRIIPDLLAHGHVRRPKLGIVPIPLAWLAEEFELPVKEGLMISQVIPGGAAAAAGIRGGTEPVRIGNQMYYLGGDIITNIDSQPVRTRDDLDRVLGAKNIGDRVQVEVVRGKRRMTLTVELSEPPEAPRR